MNIVVSGGWGYGNIGDDAILEATLRLLEKRFSDADIILTSYDPLLTEKAGFANGSLPSVHRLLDGTRAFGFMQTQGHCMPSAYWPRIPRRFYERFVKSCVEWCMAAIDIRRHRQIAGELMDAFASADVFIMSGGGYFNQWPSMFKARIRELELAHKSGCRVLMIGQSMGPYTAEQAEILKTTILPTDRIVVRDQDSMDEMMRLGIKAELAPDLAMGFGRDVLIRRGRLLVVPAELQPSQEETLAIQIAEIAKKYQFAVCLTLTRLICPDIATLRRMKKRLHAHGVEVEVVVPKTYQQMLSVIEGSEWVLSRGLHAMILGWRAGSRVFALTKSRKVDGFLAAVGCSGNQCDERSWSRLEEKFALVRDRKMMDCRAEIAQKVERAFSI